MKGKIKYAVEPMFDTENSNQILGYIVSKCLVKKSYNVFEDGGRRFNEVIFPFANHEDIKNYIYDPFEKGLRTRVLNIYDNYENAKLESDLSNKRLHFHAVDGLEDKKEIADCKSAYEIRVAYFNEIEEMVLSDTEYLDIDKDKSRLR